MHELVIADPLAARLGADVPVLHSLQRRDELRLDAGLLAHFTDCRGLGCLARLHQALGQLPARLRLRPDQHQRDFPPVLRRPERHTAGGNLGANGGPVRP